MTLNSEQKFVVFLNCIGTHNIFNLRALLLSSSGYFHTEELTGPSFLLSYSFTPGNTEEFHPRSYYTVKCVRSPAS